MALKLITPPGVDPVTLAEAKQYCRVDHADDDALITTFIKAATKHCDGNRGVLGRAIVNQTYELYYDAFPAGPIQIPLGPLQSVPKVEYLDATTGTYVEWPSANYTVDTVSYEGWIAPVDIWPSPKDAINAVKVTFIAGHGATAADVPDDIRVAIMSLVAHWYQNREAVGGDPMSHIPLMFDCLIGAVRKITV